jgi:hypothetical protein
MNLQDAIAILKMIVGLDGNGKVALSDAMAVLKHVVGLPSPAPQWVSFNEVDTTVPSPALGPQK